MTEHPINDVAPDTATSSASDTTPEIAPEPEASAAASLPEAAATAAPEAVTPAATDDGLTASGTATPEAVASEAAESDATAAGAGEASPADEPEAGQHQEEAQEQAGTAAPAKRPVPRPIPRPLPRQRPASPAAPAAAATGAGSDAAPVTPVPAIDPALAAQARAFGTVADDGTVSVTDGGESRVVGQVPGAAGDDALDLYVRRYLDLAAKVELFAARLQTADLAPAEITKTIASLAADLEAPAAVGDLPALRARLAEVRAVGDEKIAAAEAAKKQAKDEAVAARTAIVEAAERLAAADPDKTQWKRASEQVQSLLSDWKQAQRSGVRIDRPVEEELWQRFSHARTTFDRQRRHFFASLEKRNSEAKGAKEKIVAEAERLSASTDWAATASAYRELMDQWKRSGQASRKDDDALWARFRAAQDAFFNARQSANAAIDAEYSANLEVKEQLLAEAQKLVPVTNLAAAKQALRGIQERWEAAGKVPRDAIRRIEGAFEAVEREIRDAEQTQWVRSNPETKARAEGAAAQLETAIAALESELEQAKAAGDATRVKDIEDGLAARKSWLAQIVKTAQER